MRQLRLQLPKLPAAKNFGNWAIKIVVLPDVGLDYNLSRGRSVFRKGQAYVQFQNFVEAAGTRLRTGSDSGCGFTAGLHQPTFTRCDEDCTSAGPFSQERNLTGSSIYDCTTCGRDETRFLPVQLRLSM